jgi:hypothetical protein
MHCVWRATLSLSLQRSKTSDPVAERQSFIYVATSDRSRDVAYP